MAAAAMAAPKDDLMANLPDAPAFQTDTYSGYLKATDSKKLHYAFAESMDSPSTDPIIIWFNGGPGCSSMLGMMQELGPIVVDDGEDYFKTNPHPWNERANVLFLESPAGVGWSVAGTDADLDTNDMVQSEDAINALRDWFTKFPEYLSNEVFVSGESYGGIYVPYLAWQIYQNNLQASFNDSLPKINLGGTMVGNGATNWSYDVWPSFPQTLANFQIIEQSLLDDFEKEGCAAYFHNVRPATETPACEAMAKRIMDLSGQLNWYDLYRWNYDLGTPTNVDRTGSTVIDGETRYYKKGMTMAEYTPFASHVVASPAGQQVNGDFLSDYMNREDVRKAFNIPSSVQTWEQCSNTLRYHVQDEASMWIYRVLQGKTKLMFYSGDTDGAITTYGTKRWIKELNWPVKEAWRPWFTDGQVSGYTEMYDGLQFTTIKGVGHMAPQWARKATTNMIMAHVHGEKF